MEAAGVAAKDTVGEMLALDIRRWKREGYLRPGFSGQWIWSRRGTAYANIHYQVEDGAVLLMYKARERGGEMAGYGLPGSPGLDTMHLWWRAGGFFARPVVVGWR